MTDKTIGIVPVVVFLIALSHASPTWSADSFEIDDSCGQASLINVNDVTPQSHTFHSDEDEDWVYFFAQAGKTYIIEILNVSPLADPVFELFDSYCLEPITYPQDENGSGEGEELSWTGCEQDGVYYVRVNCYDCSSGQEAGYAIRVYDPSAQGGSETAWGQVLSEGGDLVAGARITLIEDATKDAYVTTSLSSGMFQLSHLDYIDHTLIAVHLDYYKKEMPVPKEKLEYPIVVTMAPALPIDCKKGDINQDGAVLLDDLILCFDYIGRAPDLQTKEFCAANAFDDGEDDCMKISWGDLGAIFGIFSGRK